jgi:hypothetical protein
MVVLDSIGNVSNAAEIGANHHRLIKNTVQDVQDDINLFFY